MSRAGSAARSSVRATGNRGIASRILRTLGRSSSFQGSGASFSVELGEPASAASAHRSGARPTRATARAAALAASLSLVALIATAALAAPSLAAPKDVIDIFGTAGSGDGQFSAPAGAAVNQDSGEVYVVDIGNSRVQRFDANGAYVSQFGSSGDGDGQFAFGGSGNEVGIAIDPDDGSVYVADTGNNRVQKFSAAGAYVSQFGAAGAGDGELAGPTGLAVDPADGDVLVADRDNNRIQRFTSAGVYESQFGVAGGGDGEFFSPIRVGVDSSGSVFVLESFNRVQKFDSAGAFVEVFAPAVVSGATGPRELAVDAVNDRVFVGQFTEDFSRFDILEFDSATGTSSPSDTHLQPAAMATGLAVRSSTGRLYVSDGEGNRVVILGHAVPPTATIGPATANGARGATFTGSVNPNGALTGYHFEYSHAGGEWAPFPPTDTEVGAGSAPVAVSETVTGVLRPNTTYNVRLVATHTYGPKSGTSAETTVTTAPAPPTIGPVANADPDTTSATLTAQLNPNGQQTSYHFEYGTTTAYGSTAPAGGANAGAGGDTIVVSQRLDGLQPNTTYHYRLIATNASGQTIGHNHTFTTRPTTTGACPNAQYRQGVARHLPDCRAYERVSPAVKHGHDAGVVFRDLRPFLGVPASDDGQAVAFSSDGAFAGSQTGGLIGLAYVSHRDSDGWRTRAVFPPALGSPSSVSYRTVSFSEDMRRAVVFTNLQLTSAPATDNNYYLVDFTNPSVDTMPIRLMAASPTPLLSAARVTPDLRHLAFDTNLSTGEPPRVYESVDGVLRLVSGDDSKLGSVLAGERASTEGAISDDGRHVFFTVGPLIDPSTALIYRRQDGSVTALASPSRRTPVDPLGPMAKEFVTATPDGNRVFFTSRERLTDDANEAFEAGSRGDLYRYDFSADRLIDLSAGTPGMTDADVRGVVAANSRGDRVYFAAAGHVVPGQGGPGPKLYLWEDDGTPHGAVRFVATLSDLDDSNNWTWEALRTAQVTPDGAQLVFRSAADLTGDNTGGNDQVYLYDADADGGDGRLTCLSCGSPGGLPAAPAQIPLRASRLGIEAYPRAVSTDGERVFFTTATALVARDTNGRNDAYMWQRGELFLVSSGTSSDDSYALGASASGDDVFFRTREQLVPADGDTLMDVYTAHVGGGFASQQRIARGDCEGDGCQGAPSGAPARRDPGSLSFEERGDAMAGPPRSLSIRRVTAKQRVRLARGRRIGLRVLVGQAGMVRVVARGRVGGRRRVVARGRERALEAGTTWVRVRLSRPARRKLARGRVLRIRVAARSTGAREVDRVTLRLRRPRGNR